MRDTEPILTKNQVLQKVKLLLEEVQDRQFAFVQASMSDHEYFSVSPKISRGDQYEGLPWLILDYPRYFRAEDVLAVRTMFWWGHFFSSTLQLSGEPLARCRHRLAGLYPVLAKEGYYAGIHSDPWIHHFREDNYVAISGMEASDFRSLCNSGHVKIARNWPLSAWPQASDHLYNSWKILLEAAGLVT